MEKLMTAICLTNNNSVKLQEVSKPENAETGHIIIKMEACGINAGDTAFISGAFPPGSIPLSQHNICGVSGVGTVIAVGEGVPSAYKGKKVTIYRSLKFSDNNIGTWCEYAHLPYQHCVILPDNADMEDYSGSLVNIITPYAFLKQIIEEEHKGIICTAGNSATGIAMLGICIANNFPIISIARTQNAKKELEELGAKNIIMQTDDDFKLQLKELSQQLATTAVFDGVGGEILNQIIDVLPFNSTIYSYGYLGGKTPLTLHTSLLMKGITIKGFGNFRTKTVQNTELLEKALIDISEIIGMPHFKTKVGKKFRFEDINDALVYSSTAGGKAVLYPFTVE
ncbi:NADPH:quinone reductase-like Zn-dependent oxidoreductase [Flavobacterium sp. 1]|uniref:zinc-binding dehydrogenase n=1 Tax=Flavobacterium sp. 1 TaxID=2035200 RepID=UPI000C24E37A|nr:zinc-binding dehydrogenase [Flavobacterium sp. 1]PJJ08154.1 NADPH:quinone reductase-like Zn-dependent oxidoreductase [Flavobacterium sp. 1]